VPFGEVWRSVKGSLEMRGFCEFDLCYNHLASYSASGRT